MADKRRGRVRSALTAALACATLVKDALIAQKEDISMNEQLLTAALDKALARVTDETGLVGGVVNVIRGGKTVYTYEYGYADRENKLPMTQDTLFDVASTSKAWTVMLAAQAIDDGLLAWDEPIQKHIPEFTMVDPYAGAHLSVRDMASHRSGLPGHDFLREKIAGDRETLMRKTAFLEPNVGFRSKYQYNNHMFILLGYLVERVRGGQLWEDQIVERIARPLGIDQIRFRGINRDMDQVSPALPYCSDGYKTDRCGYATNYHSAPCGGIRISMKNMAKWIAAMSRGGVTESGARLCSEQQYREIIAPVISAPEEDCFWLKNSSYAQGWINADYKGHNVVFHSGGLTGFNTQVGFLPGEDCGYVMCFNTGSTPAHRVARAIVLDALTQGRPEDSYDPMIDAWLKERDAMHHKLQANETGTPITAESHPGLVGSFRHPGYESFVIAQGERQLEFTYGDFTARLMLEKDGRITGYSGDLDGLTPAGIELFPQPNGDLRLMTPDSADLKLLFVKE